MPIPIPSRHRNAVAAASVLVIALCLAYIIWPKSHGTLPTATRGYFTVDDGATLFVESLSRRAPFEYEGKTAVRAHVFSFDGGKTRFVAYLEKDSPNVALRRAEAVKAGAPETIDIVDPVFKKPLDPNAPWLTFNEGPAFEALIHPTPPDGAAGTVEEIFP